MGAGMAVLLGGALGADGVNGGENLAAFGFSSFPGVPSVIGPFNLFDARARYSQTVVDFKLLHELRSAAEKITASTYAQLGSEQNGSHY